MRRLILVATLLAPVTALAQQPPPPANSQADVAAFLARSLSQLAGENDALRAQVADLQKQVTDAKKDKAP